MSPFAEPDHKRVYILRTRTADRKLAFRVALLDANRTVPHDSDATFDGFMRGEFATAPRHPTWPEAVRAAELARVGAGKVERGYCLLNVDHLIFPND